MKKIGYIFQACLIYPLMGFFKILGPERASDLGGFIGKLIGPRLKLTNRARNNIKLCFPNKSKADIEIIISEMWEHIGRVLGEYPHLEEIATNYVDTTDTQSIYDLPDKQAIFISGHLGGWEINTATAALKLPCEINYTYRSLNNIWVDKLLTKYRSLNGLIPSHSKSAEGGKNMLQAVKKGKSLGILIDQKYNQGIKASFFGIEAMTNPFFAQIAQKYDCPIIPVRSFRLHGCRYKISTFPPIALNKPDGNKRDVNDIVQEANNMVEAWIKETPGQWLWLHRRWKNEHILEKKEN